MSEYSEDVLVERPAMRLLGELGWETLAGYDEHPGAGGPIGRRTFGEVILTDHLRLALRNLNPGLPDEAIAQALAALTRDRSVMQPVRANHEIWTLLRDGYGAVVTNADGTERIERVRYVHWTATDANDFLAVNQFWVTGPLHRRRADIVLFVNGIPLVLIELKASHRRAEDGYQQNIRDYRDTIPQLFWSNGFVVVSTAASRRSGRPSPAGTTSPTGRRSTTRTRSAAWPSRPRCGPRALHSASSTWSRTSRSSRRSRAGW